MKPTPEQSQCIDLFKTGKTLRVTAYAGTGKALRDDQPVLTPSGYRPIASLKVGDTVIGRDGLPYPVLGVFPQGVRPLFDMRLSDGTSIISDADHIWTVQRADHRASGHFVNRTTAELAKRTRMQSGPAAKHGDGTRAYWWLPMCEPVNFGRHVELPIAPWLLGVLIGDASMASQVTYSTADVEMLEAVAELVAPFGITTKYNGGYDYRLTTRLSIAGEKGCKNLLVTHLKALGLQGCRSWEKFIPEPYKFANPDDRLALLQGLFDTDGSAHPSAVEFTTTSKRLSADVAALVHSLGGTITTSEKWPTCNGVPGRLAYRSYICLPSNLEPFRLSRKAAKLSTSRQRESQRSIVSITEVAPASATCISVSSPDRLFLTTNCTPTHNTSTLKLMANSDDRSGCYLCFNRSIAEEAKKKFPSSVRVSTQHGLAYTPILRRGYAKEKLTERMSGHWLAEKMNFQERDLYDMKITPRGWGFWVLKTIEHWCGSGRDVLSHTDCIFDGKLATLADSTQIALKKDIARDALRVWEEMIDKSGRLPLGFSGYLKLWALSKPQIDSDYVLLDEAQDTNGVIMEVVRNQRAQLITVGDPHQQIYEWRGALNAMKLLPSTHEARLSTSFRFGPAIAGYATEILELLRETVPLKGNPAKEDSLGEIEKPTAIISRNNATLVENLMSALEAKKRTHVVGGVQEIMTMIEATERLEAGRSVDNPLMFYGFKDWTEVCIGAGMPDAPQDLRQWVNTVEKHGTDNLRKCFSRVERDEHFADAILSTAHKSKGREWQDVRLCDDLLMGVKADKEDGKAEPGADLAPAPKNYDAELRLFYVAATRAEHKLEVPSNLAHKLDIIRETTEPVKVAAE